MNISSVVVKTKDESYNSILQALKAVKNCQVHFHEDNKIVVTIEAENLDDEIKSLYTIEKLDGVLSAELVYAYSEDELEKEREKVELGKDVPEWLNDNNVKAEQINYRGDLKKKKRINL